MASVENLLKDAVKTEIAGDSDLSGALKGWYYGRQPNNPPKPYLRWEWLGGGRGHAFGSACKASTGEFLLIFHIFSDGGSSAPGASTEAETIQQYLHTLFDGGTLDVTGYRTITLLRPEEDQTVYEDETGLWHIVVTYRGRANPSPP